MNPERGLYRHFKSPKMMYDVLCVARNSSFVSNPEALTLVTDKARYSEDHKEFISVYKDANDKYYYEDKIGLSNSMVIYVALYEGKDMNPLPRKSEESEYCKGEYNIYARDLHIFSSYVDEDKYPDHAGEFRFTFIEK